MVLSILLDVYVILFGLVVGSYLNVLIYRLPRGISTVLPRSRCPRCRAAIRPWDNLPLVSFLLLRGRCRHCGAPISWRYPAVELTTALLFLACYKHFETSLEMVVAAAFSAAMLVLALVDLEHYILPDLITKPGIVLGLLLNLWLPWAPYLEALLGALLGAGILAAVAWAWYRLKKVHGMGMGDVKMLAMVGAFLGWEGVIVTLFLASLTGSLVGLALLLAGRLGLQSKLPFGVFLALGAVLALFVGEDLLRAYLEGGVGLFH